MSDWLVAADDRTGALETAAALAGEGTPVTVSVHPHVPERGVVDLGSRALSAAEAAARAAAVEVGARALTSHKIDSTLRGNWAAELRARVAVRRRPVLLLAAWPLMGRTCRDGVVYVNGSPVASVRDTAGSVVSLGDPSTLEHWSPGTDEWAVVDIDSTDDLVAAATVAAGRDWLVAGPAGAIGGVHAAAFGAPVAARVPWRDGQVVVACASATSASAEQLRRLALYRPDVEALAAPPADGPLVPGHAAEIGRRTRRRLERGDIGTLVVVGGDTAAAVLGDADRLVGGFAAPGMPWSVDGSGAGPLVITKAGGFGGADALVDLLAAR